MSETLQEANQQARRYLSNKWVKWVHNGSKPSYTSAEKNINAVIGSLRNLLEFEWLLFYNR